MLKKEATQSWKSVGNPENLGWSVQGTPKFGAIPNCNAKVEEKMSILESYTLTVNYII